MAQNSEHPIEIFYGALISGALIGGIGSWALMSFRAAPVVTGCALAIVVAFAWYKGSRHGREALGEAEKKSTQATRDLREAELLSRKSLAEANQLNDKANKLIKDALNIRGAAEVKFKLEEEEFIATINGMPLAQRLMATFCIGKIVGEDDQAYDLRRTELLLKRKEQWRSARRFGHKLLPIVEAQRGLCGDPGKDYSKKGCGCLLYHLPPTAVHLDHVVPQANNGDNDISNLQALCSACNISAGAKTN